MFSFELSEKQKKEREQAREFAERVIAPRAMEIDEKDDFAWDVWNEMGKAPYKYTGYFIPEEYEGHPRPLLDSCIIAEELVAKGKSPASLAILEAVGLVTEPVVKVGTDEQRKKYLPKIARGEGLYSFALTEPGTGSDATHIRTTATKEGDGYVLNGRKRYASFSHIADATLVMACTEPDKGARGISAFIVEKGTPGFEVLERVPCMGLRGHQDEELIFRNCKIPKENLLGKEGQGFYSAMTTFDKTRTHVSAGFVGLARAALEAATAYAKERKAFGTSLAEKQAIYLRLADIATEIDAAQLLVYRAAWLDDQGKRHSVETAKAKCLATQVMLRAADLAVDVHGGFGCTKRHDVERFYRDAKIWSFVQGTYNIMRILVARDLLDMKLF